MSKRIGANRLNLRRERVKKLVGGTRHAAHFIARTALAWGLALVVISAAIAGAAAAWHWVSISPRFMVRQVIITHGKHISSATIMRETHCVPGTRLLAVAPAQIKARIEKLPWAASVTVRRGIPDKVVISVREREPVALASMGTVYQFDKEGVLLPLEQGGFMRLPVFSGITAEYRDGFLRLTPGSLLAVSDFLAQMNTVDSALTRRIASVDCAGEVMRIVLDENPAIIELPAASPAGKVGQLKQVLSALVQESASAIKTINLRYNNLAFVN